MSQLMSQKTSHPRRLLLYWTLMTAIAFFTMGVLFVLAEAIQLPDELADYLSSPFSEMAWIWVLGAVVGLCQWLVLRPYDACAYLWPLATTAGAGIGGILGYVILGGVGYSVFGVAALLAAFLQALVLSRELPVALFWVFWNTFCLIPAAFVGFILFILILSGMIPSGGGIMSQDGLLEWLNSALVSGLQLVPLGLVWGFSTGIAVDWKSLSLDGKWRADGDHPAHM